MRLADDPTAELDEGGLRAIVRHCVEAFAEHDDLGPPHVIAALLPQHVVNHLLRLRRFAAELEGRA